MKIEEVKKSKEPTMTTTLDTYDYELGQVNGTWEIVAVTYGPKKRAARRIAEFATEEQATVAWEQVMAASGAERGMMFHVSSTPCWTIQWFDDVTFKVSSKVTRDEHRKDELVAFYRDKAKFPVKVTQSPIEHWSENPLLAID